MDRPKGAWEVYPDMDPEADVTWAQITARIDKIIGSSPEGRRHTFSGLPVGVRAKETVTILPHGARQIKVHWPESE